jgi:hypothetical protein
MRRTPLFSRRKPASVVVGTKGLSQADATQLSAYLTGCLGRKVTSKVRAKDILCMSVSEIKLATGLKRAEIEKLRLVEVLKADRDQLAQEEEQWGLALTNPPPLPEEAAVKYAANEDGGADYSWLSGSSAALMTDSHSNMELHAMVDEMFRDEEEEEQIGEGALYGSVRSAIDDASSSCEPDLKPPTIQAPTPPPRRRKPDLSSSGPGQ